MRKEIVESDAGNIVTVGPGGTIQTSSADGFIASLFATKSGNEKRSAEAKEIEAAAVLNRALADRLARPAAPGLGTGMKVVIGLALTAALVGVIAIATKK